MNRHEKVVAVKVEPPFRTPRDSDPRRMIVEQKVLISLRGKVGCFKIIKLILSFSAIFQHFMLVVKLKLIVRILLCNYLLAFTIF